MYPVNTPQELRAILRSMRQSRGLTQTELGERLGVSQKRIARIESAPEVTSYDQIARIVNILGYRLVVMEAGPQKAAEPGTW